MTLSVQFLTMLSMIVGGFLLGISLETYRRLSLNWKKGIVFTYILEIIFWFIHFFLLFYLLYNMNAGEFRFYIVIACLLGFSIYQTLFSSFYTRLLESLIRFGKYLGNLFKKVIWTLV